MSSNDTKRGPLAPFVVSGTKSIAVSSSKKVAKVAHSEPAALLVFGRDDAGKCHASAFAQADGELAVKAAGLMGMQVMSVNTDELREIASQLPQGKVFGSGRAFVPFVKQAVFKQLEAQALTVAAGTTKRFVGDDSSVHFELEGPEPASPVDAGTDLPKGWSKIKVGSVVLASEGHMNGWFEAIVTELSDDDELTLIWRDWVDEPSFTRRRWHLALMHPSGLIVS